MTTSYPVVVIGAGQAGLSTSAYLKEAGIEHIVLERDRLGHAWRAERWDSFCLVTPNWQCRLPNFAYAGPDPDGFMLKDEIVDYLEAFAASFDPPLREGVAVRRLQRNGARFTLETSDGNLVADQVVVATGGYHGAKLPEMSSRVPGDIVQVHSSQYRNAQSLPEGDVLVVGTGQSGAQIAEDLHLAGRAVHLCVGSAPRVARRYRGRDVVAWLDALGHYDLPVDKHPLKEGVRGRPNHYVTGRDGGHDIDLRAFARDGMELYGRLLDVRDDTLHFGLDLAKNLDGADAVAESIKDTIDAYIEREGIDAPYEPRYVPVWKPPRERPSLRLGRTIIAAIVWSMGFSTDFTWIDSPVFDARGYPVHRRGVTAADGLYFLGLSWLYTWGSGRFCGVARDARYVVDHIRARRLGKSNGNAAAFAERTG
jgi:putative flavoprotein involved in K+ transport